MFTEEKNFDREQYESCLRRLRYDDRDVNMYEGMLDFLWSYVVSPGTLSDEKGMLAEYTKWNMQMIEKCYHHLPHNRPYANIRRAYQTIVYLRDGNLDAGLSLLDDIGKESFQYDGKAPKLLMIKNGKRYQPVSKLFLLYNYEKVLRKTEEKKADAFRKKYDFAFTVFGDGEHEEHDQFLNMQLEQNKDCIFYPVFERIYKIPWGPTDFYLYFEEGKNIPLSKIMETDNAETDGN